MSWCQRCVCCVHTNTALLHPVCRLANQCLCLPSSKDAGPNIARCRYAYAALQRALELNRNIWRSDSFEQRATALAEGIRQGVGCSIAMEVIQNSCNPACYTSNLSELAHCWPAAGIEKWGIVQVDGVRLYALEVDGLGNNLVRIQLQHVAAVAVWASRYVDAICVSCTDAFHGRLCE